MVFPAKDAGLLPGLDRQLPPRRSGLLTDRAGWARKASGDTSEKPSFVLVKKDHDPALKILAGEMMHDGMRRSLFSRLIFVLDHESFSEPLANYPALAVNIFQSPALILA